MNKDKLFIGLLVLAINVITMSVCGIYRIVDTYDDHSRIFAEGYSECLKDLGK